MTTLTNTAYGMTINWWHCNRCGELRRQLGNEVLPPAERICAFCKSDADERRIQRLRDRTPIPPAHRWAS
jgi:hypothetical protein